MTVIIAFTSRTNACGSALVKKARAHLQTSALGCFLWWLSFHSLGYNNKTLFGLCPSQLFSGVLSVTGIPVHANIYQRGSSHDNKFMPSPQECCPQYLIFLGCSTDVFLSCQFYLRSKLGGTWRAQTALQKVPLMHRHWLGCSSKHAMNLLSSSSPEWHMACHQLFCQ